MTLSYKYITAKPVPGETMWPCSDEYYHKGTWYMEIFLCQLLCSRNKNQFCHYFGLLHDLLHRQYLLNKWFKMKLRLLMIFSILANLFHQVCFIARISKATLKWRWIFSVTNNSNFLHMSWVICPAFSFSRLY